MSRLLIKHIDECSQCPYIGWDMNITRYECKHKKGKGKRICWMDGNDKIKIPEWCPLPSETIKLEDMEI